ncbi:carboxymuconolactone decarboxylase family protein [Amycolatopsis aidingensis]|uniref:carboxymuconolactone decarboxylase family protein n=1 Tax=Amycolatopsis aidingensis TaxID=2842453 RepID=UPI001C0CEF2A|nr:carboxymuconolactone decarboxylase family protein [Amycolatopsis aidingensis]
MQAVVRAGLRDLSTAQVRQVRAVRFRAAGSEVARVYREIERDFGVLAPPIVLHAPAPDVMAACWLMLRETLLVPGAAPRAHKEAVSTAVSAGNSCPFCVTMHSSMLADLVGYREGAIPDPAARAAAEWATANAVSDGGAGHPVPFPAEQAPEMVGTAVILQYLNRMVNIFLGEAPLPPFAPAATLGVVRRVLVWLIKSAERGGPRAGASLDLLPAAPPHPELGWSAGNPAIAEAYARGTAVIEAAGRRSIPAEVRELVSEHLARWDGRPIGPSRAWVEDAVAALPGDRRPAGRLALLTALASYQIDQPVLDDFRAQLPADRALIDLTSWASLAAALRAGSWMAVPSSGPPAVPDRSFPPESSAR